MTERFKIMIKQSQFVPYTFAYTGRGNAHFYKGEYDRAIQDFNAAIDRTPTLPHGYIGRGYVYLEKGEYDKAIEGFDTAIGLDANNSGAYYGRGLAHSSLGDVTKARSDLNKALELGHDRDEVEAALKKLDDSG